MRRVHSARRRLSAAGTQLLDPQQRHTSSSRMRLRGSARNSSSVIRSEKELQSKVRRKGRSYLSLIKTGMHTAAITPNTLRDSGESPGGTGQNTLRCGGKQGETPSEAVRAGVSMAPAKVTFLVPRTPLGDPRSH
eukprot:scaffold3127_cov202-Prasinococcus_capsulatus_cf.AAC.2